MDARGFVMAIEPVKEKGVAHPPVTEPDPPDAMAVHLAVLEIAARFLATRTSRVA